MKFKGAAIFTGLALGLLSGAAHASVLDFKYYTDTVGRGSAISAHGTIDVQHTIGPIYKIVGVTGVVNGSIITGLQDAGNALFTNITGSITGTNNVSMWLNTLDGIKYSFGFGIATSSSNDSDFGRFIVSAVPLPSSAPLFGAAILCLAGFGYAANRKKVPVA